MNLHAVVAPYIAAINPWLPVVVTPSRDGYATAVDGTRVPNYGPPYAVLGQAQSLTYSDIQQVSGLSIQGERRAIYLRYDAQAIVRQDMKGGDIITFPDGHVWLVAMLLENWVSTVGWVKVVATRQMPGASALPPPVLRMLSLAMPPVSLADLLEPSDGFFYPPVPPPPPLFDSLSVGDAYPAPLLSTAGLVADVLTAGDAYSPSVS